MRERIHTTDKIPFNENLDKFAPSYTPENFTEQEQFYLKPFFSNIDRPIFVTHNLPEEVNAALDSRYSRSTLSKRKLFLKEYVGPIIAPEKTLEWAESSPEEKKQALEVKDKFNRMIKFLNEEGGLNYVVNIQRARKFFDVWLSGYGDDSIAEMGAGIHVSMEGISSVALEEVVNKRVGLSPLVKSTRYVRFDEKRPDGEFQFTTPGEIKGTEDEKEYKRVMDLLFTTYSEVSEPYLDYIKNLYPKGPDETDKSFDSSRKAKRLDDIRDLLPFATQNNMGLAGNGRAFEDLVNRMLASNLGELRYWGQQMANELTKVVPSFIERPKTNRGAEIQIYRRNIDALRDQMSSSVLSDLEKPTMKRWVGLVSHTPEADVEILSTFLFSANSKKSLEQIRKKVKEMSPGLRRWEIERILKERSFGKVMGIREKDRFKKVPRAFENAKYLFEIWGRGGDMRDLHRHRQATEGHPPYTTSWGYDLESEVNNSPFIDKFKFVFEEVRKLNVKLEEKYGPEIAQYATAFGFLQHWYMNLTAREIYWIGELRTGPQARPHYKEITLQIVDLAIAKDPSVFAGVMVDRNDYRLARRESEKKLEKKIIFKTK